MSDVFKTSVVTGFLTRGEKILLLKRSSLVGTYKGFWAGVSGYLERDDPEEQAWAELKEELDLGPSEVDLEFTGGPIEVRDKSSGRVWIVHPFRFSLVGDKEPRFDWEHVEMRWVHPEEMRQMEIVPGLWEAWSCVSGRECSQ
jgi:8-oxo-dGTP diphosphatase